MCLHGPDTMKSGFNFRRQKETKLQRFELFSSRLWLLHATDHSDGSPSIKTTIPHRAVAGALC